MVRRWRGGEAAQNRRQAGDTPNSTSTIVPNLSQTCCFSAQKFRPERERLLRTFPHRISGKTNKKNKEYKHSLVNRSVQRSPAHLQSQGRGRKVSASTTQLCQSPGTAAGESRLVHPIKGCSVNTAERRQRGAAGNGRIAARGRKIIWQPRTRPRPTLGRGRLSPEISHCPSKGLLPASHHCHRFPKPHYGPVEFPLAFCFMGCT